MAVPTEPYIAEKDLVKAVQTARYLGRPLLLEGEAGCGKTRLAYAVAAEMGFPIQEISIRSSSKAEDLLYQYDALRRLYDIHEVKYSSDLPNGVDPRQRENYVGLGPLGQAIEWAQEDYPSVVLIDEVDKADIDFPNDLLEVLDRMSFHIPELANKKYDALKGEERQDRRIYLPVIIVTSNREKELPRAFLRRCIYHYIHFPQPAMLDEIVSKHLKKSITPLFVEAVRKFWALRDPNNGIAWRKRPGTSELLDWIFMLEKDGISQAELDAFKKLQPKDFPHKGTLVKDHYDLNAIENLILTPSVASGNI